MKARRSYEKPSEKRAREKGEAVRRNRKAARKLGWLPDKKDDDDRQRRRRSLVPLVAVDGGESQLLSRAVELAATWQQLPLLVRNGVLAAAVRGSKEMFSTLRDAALGTDDAQIQLQLLRALMVDDDPVHGDQAMQLALDARVDPGAARVLFWGALDNPAQWAVGAAFVRGHFDRLVPPLGGAVHAGRLTSVA